MSNTITSSSGQWSIHKDIDNISYGHRVYSQTLNDEFADNLQCACRHFHGHNAKITVYLTGDTLIRGFVTDFRHLEFAKRFVDSFIDHQFLMDINDPMFQSFVVEPYNKLAGTQYTDKFEFIEKLGVAIVVPNTDHVVGYRIDLSSIPPDDQNSPEFETLDGITVLDFVPTSENLSKWCCDWIQAKMSRIDIHVSQVDWWETSKSCASYIVK